MSSGTLLGICGSLRAASTNRKLMLEAARVFAPDTFVDGDIRFPLYDGDLEDAEGIPDPVTMLAAQIAAADAIIVVGPEYNKVLSGALKNALDWVSRVKDNPWRDKPVAILSAAAGRAGGERSQITMRLALTPFRPKLLTGPEVMVAASSKAFDEDGRLIDEFAMKLLRELMDELRKTAGLG